MHAHALPAIVRMPHARCLARRSCADAPRRPDVRGRRCAATTWRSPTLGRRPVRAGPHSRARASCTSTATCRRRRPARNGRHPLPSPEAARGAVRPPRHRRAHSRSSPTTRAAACTPRGCGGCCAGSATTPSPCSTAAIAQWRASGRPVVDRGSSTHDARDVHAAARAADRAASTRLRRACRARRCRSSTRARAERFRGENEPIDPVAGHIPGARNRPYTRNLDADGTFKPPARAARGFDAVLAAAPPTRSSTTAARGVTACHNLLAMERRRLSAARALYPGSWSEWASDRTRPVATGPVSRPACSCGRPRPRAICPILNAEPYRRTCGGQLARSH